MLRRRSVVSLVIITVIAIVATTVAVVYAVQTILQTREVSATVNIQSGGERILVCSDSDTNCTTLFTGDLNFGNMLTGTSRSAFFRIKNILTGGLAAPVFVDARIRFFIPGTGDVVTPLSLRQEPCAGGALCGNVPGLGKFLMEYVNAIGDRVASADTALQPREVRRVEVKYTSDASLAPGTVNFDILVDAVDAVE